MDQFKKVSVTCEEQVAKITKLCELYFSNITKQLRKKKHGMNMWLKQMPK